MEMKTQAKTDRNCQLTMTTENRKIISLFLFFSIASSSSTTKGWRSIYVMAKGELEWWMVINTHR